MIQTEGFQCGSDGASATRLALIDSQLKPIGDYIATLSDKNKDQAQRGAAVIMFLSFKDRTNDIWLCRGGSSYMAKVMQAHPDEGKEVSISGAIGKNIVFPTDPSILPDFVPYAEWKEKRHAALDKLFKEIGIPQPTDYLDAQYRML